ncbi:hypothetical protein D3C76_1248980 [compost metagenome]
MAKIQTFVFQRAEIRRQIRKGIVIEIGALQTFAVDINQVQFRVSDGFRRFFVICREIWIAVAGLRFHQLGDLMERRAGINRTERQRQGQQAVAHMMRKMTTTAQHPAESAKHREQRQY